MSDIKLHWNKSIPYYEIPLLITTNLSNDVLEKINSNYDFLLSTAPVFQLFYIEYNQQNEICNVNYSNYSTVAYESYTLEELLKETIFKNNIVTDKKISVVHAIKKHSNYWSIRYIDVYLKHLNGNPLAESSHYKSIIRKEKIKLLTQNDNNKKSFKHFVNDIKSINDDVILSKEI
jgi:hypothetical protein